MRRLKNALPGQVTRARHDGRPISQVSTMDRLLIASDFANLTHYLSLAETMPLGLELQIFADPAVLSGNFKLTLERVQRKLSEFAGIIGVHGAFLDMASGSPDPAIVSVTRARYRQGLQAAQALRANYMVVHLNYLGVLKLDNYRAGWHRRQVDFWGNLTMEAAAAGVPILLENAWEDDPTLITDILAAVDSPFLRACLDVAHATLYTDLPIQTWIDAFEPYLHCCHLNNHDGQTDLHWPLDTGILDFDGILPRLRRLPQTPLLVLEMNRPVDVELSLHHFQLSQAIQD